VSDQTDRDLSGNGLTLSGWGATLRASGREVVVIVLMIFGFASNGLILWLGLRDVSAALLVSRTLTFQEHVDIRRDGQETACVLMLDPSERLRAIIDPLGICHYVRSVARAKGFLP